MSRFELSILSCFYINVGTGTTKRPLVSKLYHLFRLISIVSRLNRCDGADHEKRRGEEEQTAQGQCDSTPTVPPANPLFHRFGHMVVTFGGLTK